MRSPLALRHNLRLELLAADGTLLEERRLHNTLCTAGKRTLLATSGPLTLNSYPYICIGTGTTPEDVADTGLQAELVRASGALTNPTPDTWQVQHTFPAGTGTGMITEYALDSAAIGSGAILARKVDSGLDKAADKSLRVTWTATIP